MSWFFFIISCCSKKSDVFDVCHPPLCRGSGPWPAYLSRQRSMQSRTAQSTAKVAECLRHVLLWPGGQHCPADAVPAECWCWPMAWCWTACRGRRHPAPSDTLRCRPSRCEPARRLDRQDQTRLVSGRAGVKNRSRLLPTAIATRDICYILLQVP